MPRANRYILPGGAYHLTHRCHNRSWLLRFARDRTEYCRRLRECLRSFEVSLLTYCVTSNHTHLLVTAKDPDDISRLMQRIEGEFAGAYNARKHRTGAFWSGRYHCTMIESGKHLRACMRYIAEIGEALTTGSFLQRDTVWTDSIAIGSESFVMDVAERTRNRMDLDVSLTADGLCTVRKQENTYEGFSVQKT